MKYYESTIEDFQRMHSNFRKKGVHVTPLKGNVFTIVSCIKSAQIVHKDNMCYINGEEKDHYDVAWYAYNIGDRSDQLRLF